MTWPEYLDKLATTALLGTELSELPENPPLPGFEAWTNRIAVEGKEGRFLALAAASFLYNRAACQADIVPAATGAAPAETLPLISPAASDHLHAMLLGHHGEILDEFLKRVAKHQRRLPPRYLPALFGRAMKENGLWPLLTEVMGERGRWLAAQNPDWKLQAIALDETAFQTGTREERLTCLRMLRLGDPARARSLLQASWAEEKPEDRAAFLEILLLQISLGDEALFDQALADKRKEVREIAFEGLAQMPQSALAKRMQARLSELIKVAPSGTGLVKLEIDLPDTLAPAWQKDGIDAKSNVQGLGDKAHRLYVIVGATPLFFWDRLGAMTPDQWCAAILQTDWHDAIMLGLAKAAIRQHDQNWGLAVLHAWAVRPSSLEYAARSAMVQNLLESLDGDNRESFLSIWMERERIKKEGEISPYFAFFLNTMNHLWSPHFSENVLHFFVWAANSSKNSAHVFGIRWKELGRYVYPEFHQRAQELLSRVDESWKPAWEPFLTLLGFREAMLKEIAQ